MAWRDETVHDKRQCEEITQYGKQCKAWALRDSDPPRCRMHSLSEAERSAFAKRMALRSTFSRHAAVEAKPRSELQPGLTLRDVMAVIAPALEATDHWTGEPLWPVRLAAAGTLLAAFPRSYRETPERVSELLHELLPERVLDREQHKAEAVFEALREQWRAVQGLRWDKLVGLYVKPYPGYMVAPFENTAKIQASRKPPEPLARAPITHLPDDDKHVALTRERDPALLIPVEPIEDEPDDGSVAVDAEGTVPAW